MLVRRFALKSSLGLALAASFAGTWSFARAQDAPAQQAAPAPTPASAADAQTTTPPPPDAPGTPAPSADAPAAPDVAPEAQAAPAPPAATAAAAQSAPLQPVPAPTDPATGSSSSVAPAETPQPAVQAASLTEVPKPAVTKQKPIRPFSAVAIAVKSGFAQGIGAEIAVPLAQRFNLRGGGSYFQYNGAYDLDGITINGGVRLRSATASVDWFPFNNRFHVSPGVTIYNGNSINASVFVPGGKTFSLGPADYSSSLTDPVHGSALLKFGNRTAPNITIGFGNLIPRSGHHFSMNSDFGIQFVGAPALTLDLQGTSCTNVRCTPSQTDPTLQQNLRQEESNVNDTIRFLRFYPIASTGLSYRF